MLVYDLLLGDRVCWINFSWDRTVRSGIIGLLAILRVSKQVHAEARRVLRVRTLRINKFDSFDFPLLPRIPSLISKYSYMIEKLLISFQNREFSRLIKQTEGLSCESQLLIGVQEIITCLPKLQSVVLTCDDVSWLGPYEEWTARLAQVLKEPLRNFDHITATVKEPSRWLLMGAQVEIKFLKRTDRGKKWVRTRIRHLSEMANMAAGEQLCQIQGNQSATRCNR